MEKMFGQLENGIMKRKFYKFKVGDRAGRLIIIEILGMKMNRRRKELMYLCKCDCGNIIKVGHNSFQRLHRRSCGCLVKDILKGKPKSHGLTYHPYYRAWLSMKYRCLNPQYKSYSYYGGRGIKIYNDWIDNPISFLEYLELLPNYNTPGATLDRIDNNGDYEPGNLRFSTHIQQCNNQRIRKDNKSGYKGIWYDNKTSLYRVTVGVNGKNIFCGAFLILQDAIDARNKYIIKNNLLDHDMRLQDYYK